MIENTLTQPVFRRTVLRLAVIAVMMVSVDRMAQAESFRLPEPGDDLIGNIRHTKAHQEDTLIDIARRFSVGQDEMVMANPTVDRWLPKEGTDVLIPQFYILPDAPRAGVVVNIPEMRLYYFPVRASAAPVRKPVNAPTPAASAGKTATKTTVTPPPPRPAPAAAIESAHSGDVITYPVSMGRMDWRTPIGKTSVVNKQKDPSWTPPASIKREHALKGDPLPDVVPPGPDNPLGKYAMRLGVAGYLIHGTDAAKADGIGMRVTHGCMRMYNEDIARLFPLVPVGAPVYLVNQPVKLGWKDSKLYMEVSQPLDEDVGISPHDVDEDVSKEQQAREDDQRSRYLMRIANAEIEKQKDKTGASVSMERVRRAIEKPTGIPVVIGGTGTGWQQGADSDEGFAPTAAREEDPNRSSLESRSSPSSRPTSSSNASYMSTGGNSAGRAVTRPYDSGADTGAVAEELYSPANPYQPGGRVVEAAPNARPADARTSPYSSPGKSGIGDIADPEAPEEE